MKVQRGVRLELKPNDRQRTLLAKHAGASRKIWNWALAERIRLFEENEGKDRFTDAFKQKKVWTQAKGEVAPWWNEISNYVWMGALRDLDAAFKLFWKARKEGREVGFPRFKKKGQAKDSFWLAIPRLEGNFAVLPKIGRIRVKHTRPLPGRAVSATVSREADRWFVSFCCEFEAEPATPASSKTVGVDLGIETFAVMSDGRQVESLKALDRQLDLLKHRQQTLSRRQKGSKRYKKAALAVAKQHARIRRQRRHFLHETSRHLVNRAAVVVLEDLNVRGMTSNHKLARSIADQGWGEFRRQVEYKSVLAGVKLIVADRWYPSSKTCSRCGSVKTKLPLSVRHFHCDQCGLQIGRDLNAAINLRNYARTMGTVDGTGTSESDLGNARGVASDGGTARKSRSTSHAATKREAGSGRKPRKSRTRHQMQGVG